MISVVDRKRPRSIPPGSRQLLRSILIDITSGRIRRAIGSVRTERADRRVAQAVEPRRGGQSKLLVPSAFSAAGQMHDSLAARKKRQRLFRVLVAAGNARQKAPRLPCLAIQAIRQHPALETELLCRVLCRRAQRTDTACNKRPHIGNSAGRRLLQAGPRRGRKRQRIFFRNGQRLLRRGRVRISRARCNNIQCVAENVGQNDRVDLRRCAVLGKTSRFYRGKPLADGIDLNNVRAARKEPVRDGLLLRRIDERELKKC